MGKTPHPAAKEMLAQKCGNDEICDFLFHPLQGRATLEKISQQKYVGLENANANILSIIVKNHDLIIVKKYVCI